jgi:hypothetical protein
MRPGFQGTAGSRVPITRRNDRTLRSGRAWVRNGDRWTVARVHTDGSMELRRHGARWAASVTVPAAYVGEHVELGYAVTAHRAQGLTTDTAHVVASPTMTRESLYVAMSRGRDANTAYVSIDLSDAAHDGPHPGTNADASARSVLFGILRHVGAEVSAHQRMVAEQDAWGSIAQLAAEYETIAATAQRTRWIALIAASGLSDTELDGALGSEAFGPLTAQLRRAKAYHLDVELLLRTLIQARGFDDAADVAAVLHARVAAAITRSIAAGRVSTAPRLIVGLIPEALGDMDEEMRGALAERRELIESRATELLHRATQAGEPWLRQLGPPPPGHARTTWQRHARTVAAYRDRWAITNRIAIGPAPASETQAADAAHAQAAIGAARRVASASPAPASPRATPPQRTIGR